MKKVVTLCTGLFISFSCFAQLYFPPKLGNTWQTVSPANLGWCSSQTDSLADFLDQYNTKGFIILKDGKIAYEKYFGTFTADSLWYWASASKSLFAFLMGQAVADGKLALADTASKYLGNGWTSCSTADEQKISIKNMLTMTSGIDDNVPNVDCTLPSCLTCLQPPNLRWAYHNAVYTLSHKVLENASNQTLNQFTFSNVQLKTGMGGTWVKAGDIETFASKLRDMARFGLLIQNNGVWQTDTLLPDSTYFFNMLHPSQNINKSYGYLWWLNGQSSFMLPQSQLVFPGPLLASALTDLWCALGKNDQKIYVSQSLGLVICRMGEDAGGNLFGPSAFDNLLWDEINKLICNTQSVVDHQKPKFTFTNTAAGQTIQSDISGQAQIFNIAGQRMVDVPLQANEPEFFNLKSGIFTLVFATSKGVFTERIFVR